LGHALKKAVDGLFDEVKVAYYGQRIGPRWQISESSASQYQLDTENYECEGTQKAGGEQHQGTHSHGECFSCCLVRDEVQ